MSVTHTITGGLVHLSGNIIQVTLTASAALTKHKLAVKVTFDGAFGSPAPEEIAPDENLQAIFCINGMINPPDDYDFTFPATEKAVAHPLLVQIVTIDIGEVYNDESGERQESWMNIAENNVISVLKGKLRPYELALLNEDGKSFASEYVDGNKFLTHQPQNQKVALLQEMKLWFMSKWGANKQILLNLEIETDPPFEVDPNDGAITNYNFQFTEEVLIANALIEFTINPTFMGVDVPPGIHFPAGTKILAYTFWLSNYPGDDAYESEHFRFVVDSRYREKEFFFNYVNPLSGVDSLRLTGEYSEKLTTESEQAYKPIAQGSGTKVASLITTSASGQRSWEINTGSKTADEMRGLRDFLESKQIFMVDPERETYKKLIPVYIEPGEKLIFDSMQDIQNFSLKIFEAHK
jgi:hypothetical protein